MDLESNIACSNCETTKNAYNGELLLLRTNFVEFKKKAICTDKLFKQLSAKRSQITKIEGKLALANKGLHDTQEQFKSTLVNCKRVEEKCSSLEREIATVRRARDEELCDFLTIKQQKAALDDELKTALRKHEELQISSNAKIRKLELKYSTDKKTRDKLSEKLEAQGLELSMLKQELEERQAECEKSREPSTIDPSIIDKCNAQEIELSQLRGELQGKHGEVKTLQAKLKTSKAASKQVESLMNKLSCQENESSLLRNMITEQHGEIVLAKQEAHKLQEQLTTEASKVIVLQQALKLQCANNNSIKKKLDIIKSDENDIEVAENMNEKESDQSAMEIESKDLRSEIETLRRESETSNIDKLMAQLAHKEKEASILKSDLVELQWEVEDVRNKLEKSEKLRMFCTAPKLPKGSPTTVSTTDKSKLEECEMVRMFSPADNLLDSSSTIVDTVENILEKSEELEMICDADNVLESSAISVGTDKVCRLSDEEVAALKLQLSALKTDVDIKAIEIEQMKDEEFKKNTEPQYFVEAEKLIRIALEERQLELEAVRKKLETIEGIRKECNEKQLAENNSTSEATDVVCKLLDEEIAALKLVQTTENTENNSMSDATDVVCKLQDEETAALKLVQTTGNTENNSMSDATDNTENNSMSDATDNTENNSMSEATDNTENNSMSEATDVVCKLQDEEIAALKLVQTTENTENNSMSDATDNTENNSMSEATDVVCKLLDEETAALKLVQTTENTENNSMSDATDNTENNLMSEATDVVCKLQEDEIAALKLVQTTENTENNLMSEATDVVCKLLDEETAALKLVQTTENTENNSMSDATDNTENNLMSEATDVVCKLQEDEIAALKLVQTTENTENNSMSDATDNTENNLMSEATDVVCKLQEDEIAALKLVQTTENTENNSMSDATDNTENNSMSDATDAAFKLQDEEIAALKLVLSALQIEVDAKTKDMVQIKEAELKEVQRKDKVIKMLVKKMTALDESRKQLETVKNKLESNKKLIVMSNLEQISKNNSLTSASDHVSKLHEEISELKLQLSVLERELRLKNEEILHMKEEGLKDAKRKEDLAKKWRLSEARTFELVSELAQRKARDEGTNSAKHKCSLLEKMLTLRDTQINDLKAELKGLLSRRRHSEPRKPNGDYSASSGRGSCDTPDLDDSETLPDLSPPDAAESHEEVAEILRSVACPPLLSPIESPPRSPRPAPYARPPPPPSPLERTTQEKMLLALVESVRSATESYERLYGPAAAAGSQCVRPVPLRPDVVDAPAGCGAPAAGGGISSFKVVDEWIKNVRPEIGADQRSTRESSPRLRVAKKVMYATVPARKARVPKNAAGSAFEPVEELRVLQSECAVDGKAREMSSSFSGRRRPQLMPPCEIVALSRRLNSATCKKNTKVSHFLPVGVSLGIGNADIFALNEQPTMATLCNSLSVDVPSQFADPSAGENTFPFKGKKRIAAPQPLNGSKKPMPGRAMTVKKVPANKKIPPVSQSLVRSGSTDLNCASIKTGETKVAVNSFNAIPAKTANSDCVVSKSKKKRKAFVEILFGSDHELPSPTKKRCADDIVTLDSDDDDNISIVSVMDCEKDPSSSLLDKPSIQHLPSLDGSAPTSCMAKLPSSPSLIESTPAQNSPVVKSKLPLIAKPRASNAISIINPIVEGTPKMDTPDPCMEAEKVTADPNAGSVVLVKVLPVPKVEDGATEMLPPDHKVQDDSCENTQDLSTEKSSPTKTKSGKSSTEVVLNSKEIKPTPVQQPDDDSSDCDLVIADLDEETSDDDKPSAINRESVSVQTEAMIKDDSSEYDSDDEPLSSLLSSPGKKEPLPDPKLGSLSICVPPPPAEVKRPFFYKPVEDAAENESPPVTLDIGGCSEQEPSRRRKSVEEGPGVTHGPPPAKLRDETGVWSKRVYEKLAHRQTFGVPFKPMTDLDQRAQKLILVLNGLVCKFLKSAESAESPPELSSLVELLTEFSNIYIVKEVMSQTKEDKGNLEPRMPPEPQMTKCGRLLTTLIVALHESKPDLTEQMLTAIEKPLCHLSDKPEPMLVRRLVSLHLGICLRLRLSERIRTFFYDVIYCFPGVQALHIGLYFLEMAPFALKHAFTAQDDIVALTIACSLMHNKGGAPMQRHPMVELIPNKYKYNSEHLPSPAQLVERMVHLLEDGHPDFVEACLVLLSKRLGWEWASRKVISPMRRLVERWQNDAVPLSAAVVALRVMAFIVRTVPKLDSLLVDTLFDRVSALLQCGKPLIYEPVLRALMMFARERHFTTLVYLIQNHVTTLSSEFAEASTDYIANFRGEKVLNSKSQRIMATRTRARAVAVTNAALKAVADQNAEALRAENAINKASKAAKGKLRAANKFKVKSENDTTAKPMFNDNKTRKKKNKGKKKKKNKAAPKDVESGDL